jgi:HEAT repeat protein
LIYYCGASVREPPAIAPAWQRSTLGELGNGSAIPDLVQAYLHGPGSMVFDPAVAAIAKIGGPDDTKALVSILEDRSLFQNLRWPAAVALGKIGGGAAVPALLAPLGDPANVVRERAR